MGVEVALGGQEERAVGGEERGVELLTVLAEADIASVQVEAPRTRGRRTKRSGREPNHVLRLEGARPRQRSTIAGCDQDRSVVHHGHAADCEGGGAGQTDIRTVEVEVPGSSGVASESLRREPQDVVVGEGGSVRTADETADGASVLERGA